MRGITKWYCPEVQTRENQGKARLLAFVADN